MIRILNVHYPTRTVLLLLCESLIVSGSFYLAAGLVLGFANASRVVAYEYGLPKIIGITILSLMLSYYFDLYEPTIVRGPDATYFRILMVLGFDCCFLSALTFCFPEFAIHHSTIYTRGIVILTPILLVWRNVYEWVVGLKAFQENVFVLGTGGFARAAIQTIEERPDLGMKVVHWEEMDAAEPAERKKIWIEKLNNLASSKHSVNRIIVAMERQRGELPVEELLALRFQGICVEDVGALRERLSGKIQLDGLRPTDLLYSDGFRLRTSQQLTRLIVSTFAAAIGLILFAPLFPMVVILIKLSSKGPIFFKQTRLGVGGRPFNVYKFRSMFMDAEAGGARWATKNDPRVTRWGMFMRKTRIDEVPQLWNVLRGEMSFVGPRPERPEFIPMLSEALPFYSMRHLIRPGLTGWAQVRYGYGATMAEMREKLEYDLYYIKHMSVGLDLLIMFETIKTIVRRRGSQ